MSVFPDLEVPLTRYSMSPSNYLKIEDSIASSLLLCQWLRGRPLANDQVHLSDCLDDLSRAFPSLRKRPAVTGLDLGYLA